MFGALRTLSRISVVFYGVKERLRLQSYGVFLKHGSSSKITPPLKVNWTVLLQLPFRRSLDSDLFPFSKLFQ